MNVAPRRNQFFRTIQRAQAFQYLERAGIPPPVLTALGAYTQNDPDAQDPLPGVKTLEAFTATIGTDGTIAITPQAQWRNLNNAYLAPFVIGQADTQILSSNQRRTLLLIQNLSSGSNLYFNLGSGAGPLNGILLAPGAGYVFDSVCPYNSVSCYYDSVTPQLGIAMEVRLDQE